MNKPRYEYVLSGTGYMNLTLNEFANMPAIRDFYTTLITKYQGKYDHIISLLYNAYTEKRIGEKLAEGWKGHDAIYADSGGLQIITRGLEITDSLKNDVYQNQGKCAQYGLCFDEIPVTVNGRSAKGDLNNRTFSVDLHEPSARATGQNLRKQIETYLEQGSSCRPLLIVQGNCYDTYMRWVEYIVDELPADYVQYIGGIAIGSAALGQGFLENVKKSFYYSQLPIDLTHKHMHLLGVGSVPRIIPAMTFVSSGLYGDTKVSYDSTTHSMSIVNGFCAMNHKGQYRIIHLGRKMSDLYRVFYDDMVTNFPEYEYSFEDFFVSFNSNMTKAREMDAVEMRGKTILATVFNQILNLMKVLSDANDIKKITKLTSNHMEKIALRMLHEVKNLDDFEKWEKEVGKLVKSSPVKVKPKVDLSELI